MLDATQIAALIPHQGRMCLLERVIAWDDERLIATTRTHRAPDHPLAHAGRLRALHLCEYGAQAMAVHGGLLAQRAGERPMPRLLVSLREIRLEVAYLETLSGELEIEARRLLADGASAQYRFSARHAGTLLAQGRAAILAQRP